MSREIYEWENPQSEHGYPGNGLKVFSRDNKVSIEKKKKNETDGSVAEILKKSSMISSVEEKKRSARKMALVAAGDAIAMNEVVEEHMRPTVSLAFRFLRDDSEAQDVSQEAFLRLWRQAGSWREEAKISTWLYRVTVNLCLDRIRARKRKQSYQLPEVIEDKRDNPAQSFQKNDEERERYLILEQCLSNLSKQHRTVLTLFVFENLSLKKTASIMSISERAAESLLRRAREKLRSLLRSKHEFSSFHSSWAFF